MKNITERKLPVIVIILFVLVLLSGIFVPIYSDEIVTKWVIARFFLEDRQVVSVFPQCSTMSGRAVSWLFYPAGALISAAYSNLSPLGIRLSGITLSLVWFSLLGFWCLKQTNDRTSAAQRCAGLIVPSALGIMPYLLVLSRSEQLMTLPILIFCIAALYFKGQKTPGAQCAGATGFALMLSCFFYVHPKSVFFLPFLLTALWIVTTGYQNIIRLSLFVYAVVLFAQVLHESNAIATCADAPVIQAVLSANTLLPGMMFSAPIEFIRAALSNIVNLPDRVLTHLTFNAVSQSGWLPPIEGSGGFLAMLNIPIRYLLLVFVVGTHLASLLCFLIQLAARKLSAHIALAAMLASGNVINGLFFNIQNFYAGTQFVPIAVILAMLLLQGWRLPALSGALAAGYSALLIFAVLSMATLLTLVTPSVVRNSSSARASLPGQPLSIPVFGTQAHLQSIEALGASCGLSASNAESLVLDHMTYFAYREHEKPVHVLYVSELAYGGDLTNGRLLPFLRRLGSPGVISRCEWMPTEFRRAQKEDGMGYCCVNLDQL